MAGRAVKPCGRETWEFGFLIAETNNHSSFVDFPNLMDDEEFILEAVKISPNPKDCVNYLFKFVNPNLKRNSQFGRKFLKAVFENENVYSLASVEFVVKEFGLEKEKKEMKEELKEIISRRILTVQSFPKFNDEKNNRTAKDYHDRKLEIVDLNRNRAEGLEEILESFEEKVNFYFDD